MIRAVFFDLYGTLVLFHPPREEVQAQACQPFGFRVTREGLDKGYLVADEYMVEANASQRPMSQMTPQERDLFFARYEQLVLQGAGIDVDLETSGRVWANVQEIPHGFVLFDDVLPVLDMLKLRELTLGTLTNIGWDRWDIDQICEDLGLASYLDFVITSSEVGRGKPHPPIFLAALERAEVGPAEALMVGDSYSSDVQGARGVGIRPLLLDREGMMSNVDDCTKISSLMEILYYL